MFPVGLVVFLSVSQVIIALPSPGRVNVCSRQVSVLSSRQVSNSVSYQIRGYANCGLYGWYRCTEYSRGYNLAYHLEYYATYSTNYYCCNGWAEDGLGGCPIAVCVRECGVGGSCNYPNTCECFSGFEGTQCDDIDECDDNNGGCPDLCINTEGSYYCQCYMGYVEVDGQCEAVCQPPCVHGECTSPGHCECEGDYVSNDCSDRDECRSENGGCDHICNNFYGGFECECFSGYALSMFTECLPVCDPPCENNGQCSGPGRCDCPETYSGVRCEDDVNECLVGNGGCEHICENLPGRFSCSCDDGYTGTSDCTAKDEVSPSGAVTPVSNGTSTPGLHEPETNELDGKVLVYAIGGGSGGLAVLVLVIGIIICHRKKKNENAKGKQCDVSFNNTIYEYNGFPLKDLKNSST